MRSFMGAYETPLSFFTPSMTMTSVPAPHIFAPIACKKRARSTISGSRAAPRKTVSPSAMTAASSTFSVAPTLGKSREISAPLSFSHSQKM